MNRNQKTKEEACMFYASDYHFEMIVIPYIKNEINNNEEIEKNKKIENTEEIKGTGKKKNNKEIIILTQNDLEKTVKKLLSRINFEQEIKNEILKIDWNSDDLKKFKSLKSKIEEKKDIVLIIKGQENYIENVNKNIEKWIKNYKSIKIINCYEIGNNPCDYQNINSRYSNIINTTGKHKM